MSDTGFFADFLDLELFAKEIDRDPRTVRRWLDQSNGLPYSRIGNRILIHVPTAREWMLGRMRNRNPRNARRSENEVRPAWASRGGRPSLNSNELDQDIQENKMAEDRVAPQEMELTLVNQHECHPVMVAANAAFQRIGSLNTQGRQQRLCEGVQFFIGQLWTDIEYVLGWVGAQGEYAQIGSE